MKELTIYNTTSICRLLLVILQHNFNMKNRNLIAMLVLPVVILLLLLPAIPHHHHDGEICTTIEYCNHDHCANDAHSHHHGDNTTCVAESDFFISQHHSTDSNIAVKHVLLFANIIGSLVFGDMAISTCKAETKKTSFYKSIGLYSYRSLRAPPAF